MDKAPSARRNPFAMPYSALVGDAQVDRDQLVTEQPHEPPQDAPATGDGDGGGGGE